MNSTSRYEVEFGEQVHKVLASLIQANVRRGKALALLLLSLEKNPKPGHSRELHPEETDAEGERVLEHSGFWVAYHVDDQRRTVFVAIVRETHS